MESGENTSRVEALEVSVAPPPVTPVPLCTEACTDNTLVPDVNCAAAVTSDNCGEKSNALLSSDNTSTVSADDAGIVSDTNVTVPSEEVQNDTEIAARVYESDDEVVEVARQKYRDISDSDSSSEDSEESSSTDSSSSTEDDPSDPERFVSLYHAPCHAVTHLKFKS